eukprot:TRINITY_DN3635_c0_g1_i1.p1 TRINITY_DN3635_c0_g1~~TRINITY_DN3635_c0_g1_i1.p1  ORF type:complete len:746 (+),score=152.59 TRINITY_DN3635_c0_g1_i1:58-2295(+)
MSVAGFDIGNDSSFVALARRGGIDIIANEVSNRNTPTMVSFKDMLRSVGEAAAGQYVVNSKNTISQFKRLIGRRFSEVDVQNEIRLLPYAVERGVNDEIMIRVEYNGATAYFTPVQIMAMLLKKLADTAEKGNENLKLADCVIAVPAHFTEIQRRAMFDATRVAEVNCLKLMNENSAVALAYGIYRSDLTDTNVVNVAFCDMGHSCLTVTIASFLKGKLKIRGVSFDRNLGGRDFDRVLYEHFADEILKKHKLNVRTNTKATIRLLAACEKLKKVLSANAASKITVESIMEDTDISFDYSRDELEKLISTSSARIERVLAEALLISGLTKDQVSAVEITGGSSRVPLVQKLISSFFGKEVSKSLNFDEAIARGCALQAAILSPLFKVRNFEIYDMGLYPISLSWIWTQDQSEMEIIPSAAGETKAANAMIPRFHTIPFGKSVALKYDRASGFELRASYHDPTILPQGSPTNIGRYVVDKLPPVSSPSIIRVNVKVNMHGILELSDVEVVEAGAFATSSASENVAPKIPVLPIVWRHADSDIQCWIDFEKKISIRDQEIIQSAEKKNALESYIYDMRDKLEKSLSDFASPQEKSAFVATLTSTEEWLYEDGSSLSSLQYQAKLDSLKIFGDRIVLRYTEHHSIRPAISNLFQLVNRLYEISSGKDPRYSHIPPSELERLRGEVHGVGTWLQQTNTAIASLAKSADPLLLTEEVVRRGTALDTLARSILISPTSAAAAAKTTNPTQS